MRIPANFKMFFWAFVASMFLCSCGDMTEELYLEKDGSGKWEYKMDLGSTIEMISMMGGMMGDSTQQVNPDDLWKELGSEKIDTMINMGASMTPEQLAKLEHPEYLDKIKINLKGDKSEKSLFFNMAFDFDSFEQLDAIFKEMEKMSEESPQDQAAMMGQATNFFTGGGVAEIYSFDKKKFVKKAVEKADEGLNDLFGEMGAGGDDISGMMEMFMGGNKVTTIYHFPHKVKSVSNEDAKIDGNTVTIKQDFKEYLEKGNSEQLTVKFKKKFLGIF